VGAVCVEALVRICAGGDQRWSSLPRQLRGTPVSFCVWTVSYIPIVVTRRGGEPLAGDLDFFELLGFFRPFSIALNVLARLDLRVQVRINSSKSYHQVNRLLGKYEAPGATRLRAGNVQLGFLG
jgi:hypothetical protein